MTNRYSITVPTSMDRDNERAWAALKAELAQAKAELSKHENMWNALLDNAEKKNEIILSHASRTFVLIRKPEADKND